MNNASSLRKEQEQESKHRGATFLQRLNTSLCHHFEKIAFKIQDDLPYAPRPRPLPELARISHGARVSGIFMQHRSSTR